MKSVLKKIIPAVVLSKLRWMRMRYFDGYAAKSYSQEGEDMILRYLLQDTEKGFYVDVGAHHPKRFSNTYYFYQKGWSGINIDAMPDSMRPFHKQRPRDINVEAAISRDRKELVFFMFNEPAFNSFNEELSRSRVNGHFQIIKEQKIVPCTLAEILGAKLPLGQKINFMSVDVEGLDLEVLESNDWELFRPEYILIESFNSDGFRDLHHDKVYILLAEKNYELLAKTVHTLVFREKPPE